MQLGRVPDNVDGSVPPSSGDGQSQPTNSETGADSSVSSVGDGVPLAYGMGPSTDTNASGNGEHIQLLRFEAPTDSDARVRPLHPCLLRGPHSACLNPHMRRRCRKILCHSMPEPPIARLAPPQGRQTRRLPRSSSLCVVFRRRAW